MVLIFKYYKLKKEIVNVYRAGFDDAKKFTWRGRIQSSQQTRLSKSKIRT